MQHSAGCQIPYGLQPAALAGGGVGLRLGWNRLLCAERTIGGRGWALMGRKFRNGQTLSKSRPSSRLCIALSLLRGVPLSFLGVALGPYGSFGLVGQPHLFVQFD